MDLGESYHRQYRDIRKREETKINRLMDALFSDLSSDQEVKDTITKEELTERLKEFVDSRIEACASMLSTHHGLSYRTAVENYIPLPEGNAYSILRRRAKEFLLKYI